MSASVSTTRPIRIVALGVALAVGLIAAGAAPLASAEVREPADITFVSPDPSDEYAITLERVLGGPEDTDWIWGSSRGSYLELTITNLSGAPQVIALGADLHEPGVLDPLWLGETWNAGPDSELGSFFKRTLDASVDAQLIEKLPDWPGKTYAFYRLDDGNGALAQPQLIGTHTTGGGFVPFAYDEPTGALDIGQTAEVSGVEIFPGATATVTASGLTAGEELGLWLTPGYDYFWFLLTGAQLPAEAVNVGSGVVASTGELSAPFVVPHDTPYGSYQLMVGDPATRDWPAGTEQSFRIDPPAQSSTEATPTGSDVAVTVPLGPTSVDLAFPSVTTAGETTAVSSATGPETTGFTIPTDPALYFHISTTAEYTTPVEVCINYDPATVSASLIDLYHYTVTRDADGVVISSQWTNITTTRESGRVCGLTDSFSPFTLGVPTDPQARASMCANGGWRASTSPVFKNQGDCVRYLLRR